jgi:hypothetical protein
MAKRADMIGYCGLYCGTCPAYTGSIADPASQLRKELRRSKCDKAAAGLAKIPGMEAFEHYRQFDELLAALAKMRCKKPCRAGGGSAQCKVRKCAKEKGLSGCWECDDFRTCATLGVLEEFGDVDRTYLKNLRKIKRQGPIVFAKEQDAKGAKST